MRLVSLILFVAALAELTAQSRIPSGFRATDDIAAFWDPPWVQARIGGGSFRPIALQIGLGTYEPSGYWSRPIRLDNGTTGTLRVSLYSSLPRDWEHARIQLRNPDDTIRTEFEMYPAYGQLNIVPIDLVGGPGDELIVVAIKTHASPPVGHHLTVWRISTPMPELISERFEVSNLFFSDLIGCARWKSMATVDLDATKPRSIVLQAQFAASTRGYQPNAECHLTDPDQLKNLRNARRAVFDGSRYHLK